MLELDDGTRLVQTEPILEYLNAALCKDALQQNDDPLVQYNASCLKAYYLYDFLVKIFFPTLLAPAEKKEEMMQALIKEHVPKLMDHTERKLPDTKFLLGDKMGQQDLDIAVFFTNMYQKKEDDKLKDLKETFDKILNDGQHNKLLAYVNNLREVLKDHLASRPVCSF